MNISADTVTLAGYSRHCHAPADPSIAVHISGASAHMSRGSQSAVR